MKVVFAVDVRGVAKAGDTKEVADGYARNYLIPNKLAMPVTGGGAVIIGSRLEAKARKQAKNLTDLMRTAAELNGIKVTLKAKAGAQDRLYGAITSADIAAAIKEATGYSIDKRKIELDKPIHQLGSLEVPVKLGNEITATVKVNVVAEGA